MSNLTKRKKDLFEMKSVVFKSRPIQSIKAATFTKSEYLYLIWLGYSDEAIRHGLEMSKECYFIYRLTLLNE